MKPKVHAALANWTALQGNINPGRGVITGKDLKGENVIQIAFITGRSAPSKNRVLLADDSRIFTEAADPSQMTALQAHNTIYNVMLEGQTSPTAREKFFVFGNGNHTDTIVQGIEDGMTLEESLRGRQYEDDSIRTPRIAGMFSFHPALYQLAILRKSDADDSCERETYTYDDMPMGLGRCITTYVEDGNPPPHFRGEPLWMPLIGGPEEIFESYWDALHEPNRVALALKAISLTSRTSRTLIRSKKERV